MFSPELMLLGFISLLLTVFQGLISDICISPNLATQMLPCKRPHRSPEGSEHYQIYYDAIINRRRLFSTDTGSDHCRQKVIANYFILIYWGCYQCYWQRILESYKCYRLFNPLFCEKKNIYLPFDDFKQQPHRLQRKEEDRRT